MLPAPEANFACQLVKRLGPRSQLSDAATGHTVSPTAFPARIAENAAALRAAGLYPGDRILIGCNLSIATALTYLGSIYAGLVAVPVDERSLRESRDALVEATGAKAVWTEGLFARGVTNTRSVLFLQGELSGMGAANDGMRQPAARASADLAALMATSGSTGLPRFVVVSHGNLISNTEAIARSQALRNDEMAMLILPLNYCFGASVLHTHLWQGGGVALDRRFMFPDKVLHSMAEFKCTTFAGVPTAYNVLLQRSDLRRIALPSLRRFLQAGGPLAPEKIDAFRAAFPKARFYAMYGQTEATSRIACMDPDRWPEKRGSVGRPLDNLEVRICDAEGEDVPAGESGELLVRGPSVCRGYWNDPQETDRNFREGWLHTGDIARRDGDGYLWIEGRQGAFLKMRGIRVGFPEVEAKVMAIPGVNECAARAISHAESGEALMLYVVTAPGAQIATEEVRRRLPANWTIESIRLLPELPKTSSGKVALAALPK